MFVERGRVYLCMIFFEKTQPSRIFPLYRFMHGTLADFGREYTSKVKHVTLAANMVLRCLLLLLRSGIHHCDVKCDNVLYRIESGAPTEFVLSDFGSAMRVRKGAAFDGDLARNILGTPGFMSPLAYMEGSASKEYKFVRHALDMERKDASTKLEPAAVWASFEAQASGISATQALQLNDMFAVGMIICSFECPGPLLAFGQALVSGRIKTLQAALAALDTVAKGLDLEAPAPFWRKKA
jgi:serine/threonine protein kinase